jgi:hypothetical protein
MTRARLCAANLLSDEKLLERLDELKSPVPSIGTQLPALLRLST